MDRLIPSLPSPPSNPPSLFLHLLLPLFLTLTAFGPGYQTISSFTLLYFPLSVFYTRTCTRWWWLFLFYIMNSIGTMLAYMNTFNLDGIVHYQGVTFGIGLLMNLIILMPNILDRIAQRKFSSDGWARMMVFPCVWTGLWTIMLFTWPLGDWGNYAFALLNYGEIMQFASFAGLGGINFLLSWSGTIGSDIISYHILNLNHQNSAPTSSNASIIIDNEDNNTDTILRTPPARPRRRLTLPTFINSLSVYLFILFLVISYGGIRLSTNFVPFYQQKLDDTYKEELISFGCIVETNDGRDMSYYVNLTQGLATSGNKIILWSEGILIINNVEELNSLYDSIKRISTTNNVLIGFTYLDNTTENHFNKQVVIDNKGEVVLDYNKRHLVPVVEAGLTRGENKLQTFQSEEFGTVGAAICFDFDFPGLIGQASSKNVNLMLDSSETWGPVGSLHARMNAIRSIENGFAMFRCNSIGISGVWNQYGQPLHSIPTAHTPNVTFQVPIPIIKNRIKTVYSIFGETFGWVCVGGSCVYLIAMILAYKGSNQWKARIQYWF